MNKTNLAICGLLALGVITANAMNDEAKPNKSIRRVTNQFYMDLHYAISSGQTCNFMEALNNMEVHGHALEGEDYDDLMEYAKQKGFGHAGILEDNTYQKFTAAVLKDDVPRFIEHLACGEYLNDGQIYWLLDLAKQTNATCIERILAEEYSRRGSPSPTSF